MATSSSSAAAPIRSSARCSCSAPAGDWSNCSGTIRWPRRRRPVDLGALERLLVRFSGLVVEQPRIKEIDIIPLLASPKRLIALDARVVLHVAEVDLDRLPRPAISPYPTQYVAPWTGKNGL